MLHDLAYLAGAHAPLVLAAAIVCPLVALLLAWTWAARYGPRLQRRYARLSDWMHATRALQALHRRAPALERFSLRTAFLWIPLAAFATIVFAIDAFGELADGIGPGEALHGFDLALAASLQQHTSPEVRTFFGAATRMGDAIPIVSICLTVAAVLLAKRRIVLLYGWMLAVIGSALLNPAIKVWFARERPGEMPLLDTWSFPSGHAMNSLVTYGMLVYLLSRALPRPWLPVAAACATTVVMLIGASRMFLNVHYASDILAGFLAGLAWLAVCIAATELRLRRA